MKLENSPIFYEVSRCSPDQDWVCLLHAAYVDHGMFREQEAYFKDKFNLLHLDILGHGKSAEARKGDSLEQMAGWLRDILDAEGIKQIHLAGISLGAVLVQDFANKYPDRVASLACFGGYNCNNFDAAMQKGNAAAQMGMMLKALVSIRWFSEANKKISAYTPQAQNEFYQMNLRFPKKSFIYLAGLNSLVNKYPPMARPYPLLIGCGAHDIPMERKAVELWKEDEPNCQTVMFENAGHCVNMDAPQQFNEVMETFWTRRPSV